MPSFDTSKPASVTGNRAIIGLFFTASSVAKIYIIDPGLAHYAALCVLLSIYSLVITVYHPPRTKPTPLKTLP